MRAKGLLHLREDATHRYILQVIGRRFSIQAERPWDDAAAPASQLVVIGLRAPSTHAGCRRRSSA